MEGVPIPVSIIGEIHLRCDSCHKEIRAPSPDLVDDERYIKFNIMRILEEKNWEITNHGFICEYCSKSQLERKIDEVIE